MTNDKSLDDRVGRNRKIIYMRVCGSSFTTPPPTKT